MSRRQRLAGLVLVGGVLVFVGCVKRVPEPSGVARGVPHISWVFMSGSRDTPDRDFVCQSDPPNECVIPASRSDNQVFADLHFYYHGAGAETKYTGTIQVGFFEGSSETHRMSVNLTAKKDESITRQSVTDIVTSTPGTYTVSLDLTATSAGAVASQPIRQQVRVLVK